MFNKYDGNHEDRLTNGEYKEFLNACKTQKQIESLFKYYIGYCENDWFTPDSIRDFAYRYDSENEKNRIEFLEKPRNYKGDITSAMNVACEYRIVELIVALAENGVSL